MEKHFSPEKIPEFLYKKKEEVKNYEIVYMDEKIAEELKISFSNWFTEKDITSFKNFAKKKYISLVLFAMSPEENINYKKLWESLSKIIDEAGKKTKSPCIFAENKTLGFVVSSDSIEDAKKEAFQISSNFKQIHKKELLCGISYYPCLEYKIQDIVDNGMLALVHASMLKEDKTAVFNATSLNIRSDEFFNKKDIDRALAELKLALMLDDKDANVLNSLGVCLAIKKEFDESIRFFKLASKVSNDDFVMPLYNTGLIHYLKNEKDKAAKIFAEAIKKDSNHYEIPFYLGKTEFDSGRHEKALKYFQMAKSIKPNSPAVLNYIGNIFLIKNNYDKSYNAYKKALKYMPENPSALSAIGYIYYIKGENKEIAEAFLKESLEFEPDNTLFRERLEIVMGKKIFKKAQ